MQRPKTDSETVTIPPFHFFLVKVTQLNSGGAYVRALESTAPFTRSEFLLPNSEITEALERDDEILVCAPVETASDLVSMKLEKHLSEKNTVLKEGDKVQLIIYRKTDLGYKAIVNHHWSGIIYTDQVFKPLHYGQALDGYILKIRDDQKIDLTLQKAGHRSAEGIEPLILDLLEKNNGFLDINEKTAPERIYTLFGVSKKKFKMVLGGLYKRRLIIIADDGIHTVSKPAPAAVPPPAKK